MRGRTKKPIHMTHTQAVGREESTYIYIYITRSVLRLPVRTFFIERIGGEKIFVIERLLEQGATDGPYIYAPPL